MAKYSVGFEKNLAPEGVHDARIVRFIELGSVETDYGKKFKCQVSFELVDETFENQDGEEVPYVVHRTYNRSLTKRSDMGKDLRAAGLDCDSDDDDYEVEMDDLLNMPCMVEITHTEDGQYANMTKVLKMKKGHKVAKCQTELASLYLTEDDFDQEVFDSLPEFLQDQITESDEYIEMFGESKPKSKKGKKKTKDDDEDEDEDEKPKKKAKGKKKPNGKEPDDEDEDEEDEEEDEIEEDEDADEDDEEEVEEDEDEEDEDDAPRRKKKPAKKTTAKKGKPVKKTKPTKKPVKKGRR